MTAPLRCRLPIVPRTPRSLPGLIPVEKTGRPFELPKIGTQIGTEQAGTRRDCTVRDGLGWNIKASENVTCGTQRYRQGWRIAH
jgi:hypothetical protein